MWLWIYGTAGAVLAGAIGPQAAAPAAFICFVLAVDIIVDAIRETRQ